MRIANLAASCRDNPVLAREWLALRRARWQMNTMRATWGAFAFFFVVGGVFWDAIPFLAVLMFTALAGVIVLRAIAGGAASITREREQQTWDALVLTQLRPHEILVGKGLPVLDLALLPALPAVPFALIMAWSADIPTWRVGLALLCVLLLAAPYTLLAMRVSATGRRSTDAIVHAGLAAVITIGAMVPLFADLLVVDHYGGKGLPPVPVGEILSILALVAAAGVLLFCDAAQTLPGTVASYVRPTRLATAAAYVPAVYLLYRVLVWGWRLADHSGLDDSGPSALMCLALLATAHVLLSCFGGALCCAASGPPARRRRLSRRLSPFSDGCGGVLALWSCLYLLGAAIVGAACRVTAGDWSARGAWVESGWNLAAAIGGGAAMFLLCAGFGCAVAARLPRLPSARRAALAALAPVALLLGPALQGAAGYSPSYVGSFSPPSYSHPGPFDLLADVGDSLSLYTVQGSVFAVFALDYQGQPACVLLGMLGAAAGLLILAFRPRPAARAAPGQA